MYPQYISSINELEQRDIFALLANISSLDKKYKDENNNLFKYLLDLTRWKYDDTIILLIQEEKIKDYYESIIIDELSIQGQKYLNLLLQYIYQTTKSKIFKNKIDSIISKFVYEDELKVVISEYVAKYIEVNSKDLLVTTNNNSIFFKQLRKEIESKSLKPIGNYKSLLSTAQEKLFQTMAFSSDDGSYGIKELSKGDSGIIHIFINGFTNDSTKDNFKEWMIQTKDILNPNDTFLGYDWASGKDPSSHILKFPSVNDMKNPAKYLPFVKGFNIPIMIGSLSIQTISEWKKARNNSKIFSKDLALFIESQYKKNQNSTINLYGHSLGANLIHYTLEYLLENNLNINDVFLFGGASNNNKASWTQSLSVAENIYNFYSQNDYVLKYLYKSVELWEEPIGLNEIIIKDIKDLKRGSVYNYDVSNIVNGHTEYIKKISSIYYKHYNFNI